MGSGDGRPGTPGPRDGAGAGETKATYSGAVVLVGIISFVLGVIAVAVPYWGLFRPHTGKHGQTKCKHYKGFQMLAQGDSSNLDSIWM